MPEGIWERGDLLGIEFPVHDEALRAGGAEFLTRAFRAAGSLGADNRVTAITHHEPFAGGSTGRKAVVSVTYRHADPSLPEHLFVKYSRDLDDERRDRGKRQMAAEVRFGLLSQIPDFPVPVPRCMFGEYHHETGSGILVSERIAFGIGAIEPHHPKARDHEIDEPRAHYEALLTALGHLAGSHRAGRFPAEVMAAFERKPPRPPSGTRVPIGAEDIRERVDRFADFAARFPQLLPAALRSEELIAELRDVAPRSMEHADGLRAMAADEAQQLVAFCHWNANIDNAWFWRDEAGQLVCGLMDWGNVGQMDLVTAIASCLCFAEPDLVVAHLDHFLARFAAAFEEAGGGPLDPARLRLHFSLHVVSGGLRWPLGAVPLIERHVADLDDVGDRFDPRILDDEHARTQLHLLTSYLTLWQHLDARQLVDRAVRRAASAHG